jgi:hypothetical protein
MTTGRSLRKLPERFVRDHVEYDGEWTEETFTWSPEWLTFAQIEADGFRVEGTPQRGLCA